MNRFALVLLAGGVVLLVSWVAAPAAPRPIAPADLADVLDQSGTAVADMNAQVEKLRARLASPPTYPAPARNPFVFGSRIEPRRTRPVAAPDVPAEPAAPSLPTLIAITSVPAADGLTTRTAVLQAGDGVQLVKTGDTVGVLVVSAVRADGIDLVDPATARVYHVVLR